MAASAAMTEAGERPSFLVIGAQKCATTWLYECLRDHPGLHLPRHKREVEYLGGDLYEQKGADWYFSLLAGRQPNQIAGDVSVDYLSDARSPAVVHKYVPQVKLIASLREPVARASSAYYWYLRKGRIAEVGLEQALVDQLDQRKPPESESDRYLTDLIERGYYDVQLRRYRAFFGPQQMLVVLYEEIAKAPLETLRRVYRFIGVDADFVPASLNSTPKKNTYTKSLIALERLSSHAPRPIRSLVAHGVDKVNHWLGRSRGSEEPALSPDVKRRLRELYRPHVAELEALLQELPADQRPSEPLERAWT